MSDKSKPESITIETWWKPGGFGMMYNRNCLPIDHPESIYNWTKRTYPDLDPEDYGIYHPDVEKYKDMSRDELMVAVMKLAMELRSANQALEMFT
jgi:hypothetical protein